LKLADRKNLSHASKNTLEIMKNYEMHSLSLQKSKYIHNQNSLLKREISQLNNITSSLALLFQYASQSPHLIKKLKLSDDLICPNELNPELAEYFLKCFSRASKLKMTGL
jgi:hypothetical protein